MKPHKLFPDILNRKPFYFQEHPVYHPLEEQEEYESYWLEQEKRCVEGLWVEETKGNWRFMPPQLYFYINICKIIDEDEETNSTTEISPILTDVGWIMGTDYFTCRGFSGYVDSEFTCNKLIEKIEKGKKLNAKEKIRLEKFKHVTLPNGNYKKYIDPLEALKQTYKKPLGVPIYENNAQNYMLFGTRGGGKSFFVASCLNHEWYFNGVKSHDLLLNQKPSAIELLLTAAMAEKSDDLMTKIKLTQDYIHVGVGSYIDKSGTEEVFFPGFFHKESVGSTTSGAKVPLTQKFKEKRGNSWIISGTGTTLAHKTITTENPNVAAGKRNNLQVVEEGGLCFGENTKVRMFDGSIKNIQDITEGDFIMGEDGTLRTVEKTTSGVEELYKVEQKLGDDYIVTKNHILYVDQKCNVKSINDDGIKKILSQNFNIETIGKYKYRTTYGIKNDILLFDNKEELELDPYYIGAWIGDGCKNTAGITIDKRRSIELYDWFVNYAKLKDMHIRSDKKDIYHCPTDGLKTNNFFRQSLKKLGIFNEKIIPHKYLMSSYNNRMNLLAGLIDTDGNIIRKGESSQGYEFNQTNRPELINQIEFLAKSLGFKVKTRIRRVNTGYDGKILSEYRNKYVIRISGDVWKIPVKIEYKKAIERKHLKNFNRNRIDVKPIGSGKYYGFKLKESPLFLLQDGTVVHNCGNILDFYGTAKNAMIRSNKFGTLFILGTSGNMEKLAGIKRMFENPEEYDVLAFDDFYEGRGKKIGRFLPAYYADEDFRDENGNTKVEEAYEHIMELRALLAQSDSSALIDDEMMNRPIVPSEMFMSKAGLKFPVVKIRARKTDLDIYKYHEKIWSIGKLEYTTKEKNEVRWVPDIERKMKPILTYDLTQYQNDFTSGIVIYEHPPANIPNPTYKRSLYKITYDPVKDDNGGTSLCSIIVYKGFSSNMWESGLQDTVVAEYVGRLDKVNDMHEIAIKLAHYYNAKILPETNISDIVRYAEMQNKYSMLQPALTVAIGKILKNPSFKYEVGIDMSSKTLQEHSIQLLRQWLLNPRKENEFGIAIETNIDHIYSLRLLNELELYSGVGNYDHLRSAMILALWLSQETDEPIEQEQERQKYDEIDQYFIQKEKQINNSFYYEF